MNDPIGDMLARIRNSQMRGKSTVIDACVENARACSGVCWRTKVISVASRRHRQGWSPGHRSEPEVFRRRTPVIREMKRVSKARSSRLSERQGHPAGPSGSGRVDCLHVERRDVGCKCTAARMLAAKCSAPYSKGALRDVSYRKKPVALPSGVTASLSGQTIEVKGPKDTQSFTATDDVTLAVEDGQVTVTPARQVQARASAVGHDPHRDRQHGPGLQRNLQERA